jgi:hypothetical protein
MSERTHAARLGALVAREEAIYRERNPRSVALAKRDLPGLEDVVAGGGFADLAA